MNESKKNRKEDISVSSSETRFAEKFLAAAEEIYTVEKPISDRHQCLSKVTIYKIINSGALPDENVRKHLFDCPDCFVEYREALENETAGTGNYWNWARIFGQQAIRFAAVGAAVGIIFALIIFSFWRFESNQKNEMAKGEELINSNTTFKNVGSGEKGSDRQPANEIPETESNAKEKNPEPQSSVLNSKVLLPSNNSNSSEKIKSSSKNKPDPPPTVDEADKEMISLVLDENRILRNKSNNSENKSGRSPVYLPARRLNLSVKLPGDYPAGQYSVRITDAFGNVLLERKAIVKNGTLNLKNFDLRNINKPASKFCLKKGDEIPDCFDVKILK